MNEEVAKPSGFIILPRWFCHGSNRPVNSMSNRYASSAENRSTTKSHDISL